jgi:hypothetical protein
VTFTRAQALEVSLLREQLVSPWLVSLHIKSVVIPFTFGDSV